MTDQPGTRAAISTEECLVCTHTSLREQRVGIAKKVIYVCSNCGSVKDVEQGLVYKYIEAGSHSPGVYVTKSEEITISDSND